MNIVKTAAQSIPALAVMVLAGAIFLVIIPGCAEIGEVPSPAPDVIVFETGGDSLAGPIIGLVFVVIGALSLPFVVRALISFLRKDLRILLLLLLPAFFLGLGTLFVYTQPVQSRIVVDRNARVITVERDYLVRDTTTRVPFNQVAYIKYQYGTRTTATDSTPVFERYGTVKLVKRDGAELELYGNGQGSTGDLATRIAGFTGWRLEREKRNR